MPHSICRQVNTVLAAAVGLISLSLFASAAAQAQTRAQVRAQKRVLTANALAAQRFARINLLLGQISLTADQKTRIAALQAEAQHRIAAAMLDQLLPTAERKELIRVQTQGALAQTRALLFPVQRKKLSALARQSRVQRQAAGAVTVSGTAATPSVVTADGEEVQF